MTCSPGALRMTRTSFRAQRGISFALADSAAGACYYLAMGTYYVYMLSNKARTLYTGVTSDLERRMFEHKNKLVPGFTSKYNITQLVWFDDFEDVMQAIEGEKKIKGWRRSKKVALIETNNPVWKDLAQDWFAEGASNGNVDPSVARAPSG
jgi:putative endonuclease